VAIESPEHWKRLILGLIIGRDSEVGGKMSQLFAFWVANYRAGSGRAGVTPRRSVGVDHQDRTGH
jgi:hypothetical protein